jgi:Phosphatidylinositol-specific phospholipase C, X domain
LPSIPAIDFPISLHPDWMGNVVQTRPEITLGEIVLPGTHDSGSYSIDTFNPFSAVGRTQNVSVIEQLHRGARFLDLHIAGSGKNINMFHGCLKGSLFERILDDITLFCQDFPSEFIVIHVEAEYERPFTGVQKKQALDVMKQSLGDKIYVDDDPQKLLSTPIKELVTQGKQICVLLTRMYDDFEVDGIQYSESYIAKEYGFFSADKWMENKW